MIQEKNDDEDTWGVNLPNKLTLQKDWRRR